jgi:hypothetical protein
MIQRQGISTDLSLAEARLDAGLLLADHTTRIRGSFGLGAYEVVDIRFRTLELMLLPLRTSAESTQIQLSIQSQDR